MEGFLLKKGRGEGGIFGRKNWKKRWFILEGTYVTYFETFSLDKNKPVNKKGTAPVRGCTIEVDLKSEKKFGFVMTHETRKPLHMAAETEKMMRLWIKALEKAATGAVGPVTINFDEFFDALGMERDSSYTGSELNKFYRKAALKNHPDKGGDVEAFKHIQEAFDVLKARLEEEEEEKLWTNMEYVASIEKGPTGVGFGMVVVEDAKKSQIIAKKVMDKIILTDIERTSGGAINAGDQIVKIDNDDITTWTLMRVVQRLNDFRAPVGSVVKFTFRRRTRVGFAEGEEEDERQGQEQGARVPSTTPVNGFEEDERIFREQEERQKREEEETKRRMASTDEDINDIDEDDDIDSQFGDDDINDIDEGPYGEVDETTVSVDQNIPVRFTSRSNSVAEEKERDQQKEKERVAENNRKRQSWAQKDPMVHIACLQAENEENEKDLIQLRQELQEAIQERDSYKSNYHDMMLDLEDVREEAHMFLEQLEAAELECQGATRREMAAMDVLNQLSAGTIAKGGGMVPIPAEVSQQVLKNVQEAADLVQKGYDLTGEYGYNLEDSIRLSNEQSVEYAQKTAFSAAIMVDKSGIFSQKYDDSDSLTMDLISRLEESLKGLSDQPTGDGDGDGGQGWFSEDTHERYPGRRTSREHKDRGVDEEEVQQEQEQPPKKPQQHRRPPPPPRRREPHNDASFDNYQEHKNSPPPPQHLQGGSHDDFNLHSDFFQPEYQQYQQQQHGVGDCQPPLYGNANQGYDNNYPNNHHQQQYDDQQRYHDQQSYYDDDQQIYGHSSHHRNSNSDRNGTSLFQSPQVGGMGARNTQHGHVQSPPSQPPSLSFSSSKASPSPIKFGPRKKVSKAKKSSNKAAGFR